MEDSQGRNLVQGPGYKELEMIKQSGINEKMTLSIWVGGGSYALFKSSQSLWIVNRTPLLSFLRLEARM